VAGHAGNSANLTKISPVQQYTGRAGKGGIAKHLDPICKLIWDQTYPGGAGYVNVRTESTGDIKLLDLIKLRF